jgi:hypothetical protein
MRNSFSMQKSKMSEVSMHGASKVRHRMHNGQKIRAVLQLSKAISIKNIYVSELLQPTTTKLYKFKGVI